jgi:hypothetical protein
LIHEISTNTAQHKIPPGFANLALPALAAVGAGKKTVERHNY